MGYRTLGQTMAGATSTTYNTLYSAGSQTVGSTMVVCNQTTSSQTFSARIRVGGASADNKQIFIKDQDLLPKESIFLTIGLSMGANEVLEVAASTPNVSFLLSGLDV